MMMNNNEEEVLNNNTPSSDIHDVQDLIDVVRDRHLSFTYAATKRAISDISDGLKPVARKSIFAALKISRENFIKSARIAGDVIGKYHPHNAESVYQTTIGLTRPFSNNICIFDAQGNIGTPDGDKAAAMRYVEQRISDFTNYALRNLNINSEWQNNFDETLKEPKFLPFPFPICLVNGSKGIGIGLESAILPHNINEVIDAMIFLVNNEGQNNLIEQLTNIIKGPDFPTGGSVSSESFYQIYATGRGQVISRGSLNIHNHDIIITHLPYGVKKNQFLTELSDIRREKITEIYEIIDESDFEHMKITIHCRVKQDMLMQEIVNKLFRFTSLHKKIRSNMIFCEGDKVKVFNLETLLKSFIRERKSTHRRELSYNLDFAIREKEKLTLEKWCVHNAKKIINLIRSVNDEEELKQAFIELAIPNVDKVGEVLGIPIGKLSKLEGEKIDINLQKNAEKIQHYSSLLNNEELFKKYMIADWEEVKHKFGKSRKTQVIPNLRNLALTYSTIICIFDKYIFKIPSSSIAIQKLSNTSKSFFNFKLGVPNMILAAHNDQNILVLTNGGRGMKFYVDDIPHFNDNLKNVKFTSNLQNLLRNNDEKFVTGCTLNDNTHFMIATSHGKINHFIIPDLNKFRISNLIKLSEGDEIVKILSIPDNIFGLQNASLCLVVITRNGMCNGVEINGNNIRLTSKGTRGIKIIRLKSQDKVIDVCSYFKNIDGHIILISEEGIGKTVNISKIPTSISRVRVGVKVAKTKVASVSSISPDKDTVYNFTVLTTSGRLFKSETQNVNQLSRQAKGHRILKLGDTQYVKSMIIEKSGEK